MQNKRVVRVCYGLKGYDKVFYKLSQKCVKWLDTLCKPTCPRKLDFVFEYVVGYTDNVIENREKLSNNFELPRVRGTRKPDWFMWPYFDGDWSFMHVVM